MQCGRRHMTCVPYQLIMRRSRIAGKARCTIQVSSTSAPIIPVNFNGSSVIILLRYCLATYWSDELGYGFFGTIGERMRIIWRTTSWRRRGKSRGGR